MHNFSRKIVKYFTENEFLPPSSEIDLIDRVLRLATVSQKFMLPDISVMKWDDDLSQVNGSNLYLPYSEMVLEFQCQNTTAGKKNIAIFCHQEYEYFILIPVCFLTSLKIWDCLPPIVMPRRQISGRVTYRPFVSDMEFQSIFANITVQIVLQFLNALQCDNVEPVLKKSWKKSTSKNAIPYDDYHVLVVESPDHPSLPRGPNSQPQCKKREHLRRGHVRHLSDGRKIWVNSSVINKGIGGKIHKDYSIGEIEI